MTTTKRTTTRKAANTTQPKNTPDVKKAPVRKKYAPDELITCRSVTAGKLLLFAQKSGLTYIWTAVGDTTEVEFQDLQALKSKRSSYIFKPYFVIEDEELLEQPGWTELKKLYVNDFTEEDIHNILSLPVNNFKNTLKKLPEGMKQTLATIVATQIEEGTFDSINKVKVIDEVLGTELLKTLK